MIKEKIQACDNVSHLRLVCQIYGKNKKTLVKIQEVTEGRLFSVITGFSSFVIPARE